MCALAQQSPCKQLCCLLHRLTEEVHMSSSLCIDFGHSYANVYLGLLFQAVCFGDAQVLSGLGALATSAQLDEDALQFYQETLSHAYEHLNDGRGFIQAFLSQLQVANSTQLLFQVV